MPPDEHASGHYVVRYAQSLADLDAVCRLRFEVFNRELGEGLASSEATGRDLDAFDAGCHHLMVWHRPSSELVGTYRLQTRPMAEAHNGFYTAGEFDLSVIPDDILDACVELGRACVAASHRSGRVLHLLWRGLTRYLCFNRKRYFCGCSSLTSQDPRVSVATHRYLQDRGYMHPSLLVPPVDSFRCAVDGEQATEPVRVKIPHLMQLYLNYHVRVCSPPALDRLFRTIDFLVMFDEHDVQGRHCRVLFDR